MSCLFGPRLRKRFCLTDIPLVVIKDILIDIILDVGNCDRSFNIFGVMDGHDFTDSELSEIKPGQIMVPYDRTFFAREFDDDNNEFFITTFCVLVTDTKAETTVGIKAYEQVGVVAIRRRELERRRKEILASIRKHVSDREA